MRAGLRYAPAVTVRQTESAEWVVELAAERERLDRGSAAERVADVLRERIMEGFFRPGARLSEGALCTALGVSRNTLREAFRLLGHERLVTHELHRGVFVRVPTEQDIVDLYRLRTIIECGALRRHRSVPEERLAPVFQAVKEGQDAAADGRWHDVGTADLLFHRALCALVDSQRIDELMRRVLAELRLVFYLMDSPRELHEAYLARNAQIARLLGAGELEAAAVVLADYLADAEAQLVAAARRRLVHRSDRRG
jgi:DNA-binding GntR family transcriptional regulator